MGEFSRPLGDFLPWAVFLKITEVAQNFCATFSTVIAFILTKNVFGLHFGRFFPSTSGRPGLDRQKEGDWVLPRTVRVTHPRHPSLRPNS
jgi:hypothetical protein